MDRLSHARGARARAAWLVLRWVIGIGIVVVLVLRFDARGILRELGGVDLRLAIPALVGLVAMHVVGAVTWRELARRLAAVRLGLAAAIRRYYVAQAIGALTPANLGADAYRILAADGVHGAKGGYEWRQMLRPVVVQRITSSIALAGLGLAGLAWLPDGAANGSALALLILAGGSTALLVALQSWRVPRWVSVRVGPAAGDRTPQPPDAKSPRLAGQRGAVEAIAVGLGLGLAFHAGSVALSYLLVLSVGVSATPLAVLACLVVARLSILIPISPSGLGLQEGALALLFLSIGLPAEAAIAASLLNRLALLATTALGAALLLRPNRPAPARLSRRLRAPSRAP